MNLDQGSIPKLLLRFSIPAITGMLMSSLYSFIDKIFISRSAGPIAFSGIVVAMPLLMIALGLAMLAGIGGATQISIRMGEGRERAAELTLGNALVILVLISVFIAVFGLIFLEPLLRLYGASGATLYYAREYLRIMLLGAGFHTVGFGLTHMMRASGKPYEAMAGMLLGAVLNIILSWIVVMRMNLGVRGAAVSTLISQAVALVFLLYIWLRRGNTQLRFKLKSFKLNPAIVYSIFSVGISPFFAQVMGSVVIAMANNALWTHGGDLAIGAMGIITNFLMLFFMPIFGINQGSQPILGFNYGAGRYDRVKTTLKYTVTAAAIISLIGWLFIVFFPQVPIGMFTDDAELMRIAMSGMPLFAGAFLLVGVQVVMAIFFQAIGRAKVALLLNMLRQVIFFIPLLLALPPILGLRGIWLAGLSADLAAFAVTAAMLTYTLRKKLKVTNNAELP